MCTPALQANGLQMRSGRTNGMFLYVLVIDGVFIYVYVFPHKFKSSHWYLLKYFCWNIQSPIGKNITNLGLGISDSNKAVREKNS